MSSFSTVFLPTLQALLPAYHIHKNVNDITDANLIILHHDMHSHNTASYQRLITVLTSVFEDIAIFIEKGNISLINQQELALKKIASELEEVNSKSDSMSRIKAWLLKIEETHQLESLQEMPKNRLKAFNTTIQEIVKEQNQHQLAQRVVLVIQKQLFVPEAEKELKALELTLDKERFVYLSPIS